MSDDNFEQRLTFMEHLPEENLAFLIESGFTATDIAHPNLTEAGLAQARHSMEYNDGLIRDNERSVSLQCASPCSTCLYGSVNERIARRACSSFRYTIKEIFGSEPAYWRWLAATPDDEIEIVLL